MCRGRVNRMQRGIRCGVSIRSVAHTLAYTQSDLRQRDKHFTFEDPKANTGDSGSSTRSTNEWLEYIADVKEFALSQRLANSYGADSMNGLSPSLGQPPTMEDMGGAMQADPASGPPQRKALRKEPSADDESNKGRKRFSKRHSKNGLAAVF